MHEIYELKEKLCKELEEYGAKELTAGSLDVVDKLAHTIKNLDKIIEAYEEDEDGYSNRGSYAYEDGRGGRSNARDGRMMNRGGSYARGRGSNARRDSRGRYSNEGYSRADNIIDQLNDLMEDAPNDRTRMEIQKLIQKMENMM